MGRKWGAEGRGKRCVMAVRGGVDAPAFGMGEKDIFANLYSTNYKRSSRLFERKHMTSEIT